MVRSAGGGVPAALLAFFLAGALSCSLLTSLDGVSGGPSEPGDGGGSRSAVGAITGTYRGQFAFGAAGAVGDGDTSVTFDGTSTRLDLGDVFAFEGTASFTLACRFKPARAIQQAQRAARRGRDLRPRARRAARRRSLPGREALSAGC